MTSLWLTRRKETVGSIRTKNMVRYTEHLIIPWRRPHPLRTGMLSAAASLGLSLLWDTDIGLSHVDKYTYSSEEYIKVHICVRPDINSF
jgi:hypothetical protein